MSCLLEKIRCPKHQKLHPPEINKRKNFSSTLRRVVQRHKRQRIIAETYIVIGREAIWHVH